MNPLVCIQTGKVGYNSVDQIEFLGGKKLKSAVAFTNTGVYEFTCIKTSYEIACARSPTHIHFTNITWNHNNHLMTWKSRRSITETFRIVLICRRTSRKDSNGKPCQEDFIRDISWTLQQDWLRKDEFRAYSGDIERMFLRFKEERNWEGQTYAHAYTCPGENLASCSPSDEEATRGGRKPPAFLPRQREIHQPPHTARTHARLPPRQHGHSNGSSGWGKKKPISFLHSIPHHNIYNHLHRKHWYLVTIWTQCVILRYLSMFS